MKVASIIKNGRRYDFSLDKKWTEAAWQASVEARQKSREETMAKPAKRKLKESEAFQYYVKIKQGVWGDKVQVKLLNAKVGHCEGIAKAYRERAGKMSGGKDKERILYKAGKLLDQARDYASQRDSLLGRPARKVIGKVETDLGEDAIIDLIESGEFDEQILADIEADIGEELED
jgi:hypothetical protein